MNKGAGTAAALLMALIITVGCPADERDEALAFEAQGNRTAAIASYDKWILANTEHPETSSTLIHAASLHEKSLEALAFLSSHAALLPKVNAADVYIRMADLEALLGLPDAAAEHYEEASALDAQKANHLLLEAANLRLSMGETGRARATALQLLKKDLNGPIQDEAAALAAMALASRGRPEAALDEIKAYVKNGIPQSPLPYLAVREIALALGNRSEAEEASSLLRRHFENSAALYLAERRILSWVSPAALLRERSEIPGGPLQIGAFRNRDGASDLRERLENDGYISWIEDSGSFWKVFVNDPDGNTISRLAADGYLNSVPGR